MLITVTVLIRAARPTTPHKPNSFEKNTMILIQSNEESLEIVDLI